MIGSRTLKAFLFAFLLVLAGGLVLIGSDAQSFNNNPANADLAGLALIALAVMVVGLIIGFFAVALRLD